MIEGSTIVEHGGHRQSTIQRDKEIQCDGKRLSTYLPDVSKPLPELVDSGV